MKDEDVGAVEEVTAEERRFVGDELLEEEVAAGVEEAEGDGVVVTEALVEEMVVGEMVLDVEIRAREEYSKGEE